MFERFTAQARAAVLRAKQEAADLGHGHVGSEHLLLALLDEESGVPHAVLGAAGLDAERARTEIQRRVGPGRRILTDEDAAALRTVGIDLEQVVARIEETFGPDALTQPAPRRRRGLFGRGWSGTGFTPRARKVLELSLREAIALKHGTIGAEHLLLGLLRDGGGRAAEVIAAAGIDPARLRSAILAELRQAA